MKETIVGTLLFFLAICVLIFAGYGRDIVDRIRGKDDTLTAKPLLVRVVDAASGDPVPGVLLALQPVGADPDAAPEPSRIRETADNGEARWSTRAKSEANAGIRAVKEGYVPLRLSALDLLKQARDHGEWLVLELKLEREEAPVEAGAEDPPPK